MGRDRRQAAVSEPSASASVAAAPKSSQSKDKPLTDVVAGALARAGSQASIHPLDTLKVRMQVGKVNPGPSRGVHVHAAGVQAGSLPAHAKHVASEVASLYKGVFGAASGAGIIIGSYFAFYTNTKILLRTYTDLSESSVAFFSGATAAVGSSVVKVPLAVCIRSVQAGVYPNVFNAASTITSKAGVQGLFTGFLPTLLEDVPDMAVKFTVYESLRTLFVRLRGEQPRVVEDLAMGGLAGAAAAAATTPLDVVKTRMMCSASSKPTILKAAKSVLAEGKGWQGFFTGMGPRALSNGLNSAVFFCFFEAIRRMIFEWLQEEELKRLTEQQRRACEQLDLQQPAVKGGGQGRRPASISCSLLLKPAQPWHGSRLPCLSLAIPLGSPPGAS